MRLVRRASTARPSTSTFLVTVRPPVVQVVRPARHPVAQVRARRRVVLPRRMCQDIRVVLSTARPDALMATCATIIGIRAGIATIQIRIIAYSSGSTPATTLHHQSICIFQPDQGFSFQRPSIIHGIFKGGMAHPGLLTGRGVLPVTTIIASRIRLHIGLRRPERRMPRSFSTIIALAEFEVNLTIRKYDLTNGLCEGAVSIVVRTSVQHTS